MKKIVYFLILIPFFWMYQHYQTLNPFAIKGPAFLLFYLMLNTISYGIVFINSTTLKKSFPLKSNNNLNNLLMASVLVLGIIRLMRGIYLGRPVGYLFLILGISFFITKQLVLFRNTWKGEQSS